MPATLAPGTRLGPYLIQAPIGAGGMGEVYRARDERLGREVAVKTILGAAADPEWRRRFELEARAAGALNHPNVLTVYDVGETDGTPYLVTELLLGQTLRERLARGPLRAPLAFEIAAQIAEGLAAAHEKGIVHRDLKPENVFVTEDGRCKILDFGIAKVAPAVTTPHAETTPTPMTITGGIIGTTPYLSPEQARGEPADPRSDLFALGVILHEIITGRNPFARPSMAETLAAILHEEPEPLPDDVRRAYPIIAAAAARLVRKRAADRFQSAQDLAFLLRSELDVEPSARERRASAAVAGAAAGVGSAHAVLFRQITFRQGTIWNARFAPDGISTLYAAAWEGRPSEVFWSHPDTPEARSLGFPGAELHAISKRNELALTLGRLELGGWTRVGTLARVPMTGGAAREIEHGVREADWLPGGDALAAAIRDPANRTRVEFPLGNVVYETSGWISALRVSPDGSRIALGDQSRAGGSHGRVLLLDSHGSREALSSDWADIRGLSWTPDGKEIWFTATRGTSPRSLLAVNLEGRERLIYSSPAHLTIHDIALDGRVLLSSNTERTGARAVPSGADSERDVSWHDWSLVTDISADGRFVVILEDGLSCADALATLYLRGTDGAPALRLGNGGFGVLSPDGKWVATIGIGESRSAEKGEVLLFPTGAGKTRSLPVPFSPIMGPVWLPDGARVLVPGADPDGILRLHEVDVRSGAARPILPDCVPSFLPVPSSDGTSVAAGVEDERYWIVPLDGGPPREIPGAKPLERVLQWAPDGRSVYLVARGEMPMRVHRVDLETGARELWREVAPENLAGITTLQRLHMTPQAHAYAYSYIQILSELHVVEGLG